MALPLVLTDVFIYLLTFIPLMFADRNGHKALPAAVLATMFCNVTGFSVGIGALAALDTLLTQAFGSKEYVRMALTLQRSLVLLFLLCLPIALLWGFVEPLLVALGQDPEVAALASHWCRMLIGALYPQMVFYALRKYLNAMGETVLPCLTAGLAVLSTLGLIKLFAVKAIDLGLTGPPLAVTIASVLLVFMTIGGMCCRKNVIGTAAAGQGKNGARAGAGAGVGAGAGAGAGAGTGQKRRLELLNAKDEDGTAADTNEDDEDIEEQDYRSEPPLRLLWTNGWNRQVFTGWWPILRLGLPGIIMICSEWWSWEVNSLAAGWLGHVTLAAQGVALTTCALMFMLPQGLGLVASILIGNALGRGDAAGARRGGLVALGMYTAAEAVQCTALLCSMHWWPTLFASDELVLRTTRQVLPWALGVNFFDGAQGVMSGILRGCGRQCLGSGINCTVWYALGLPVGMSLAFAANMGLAGLWVGIGCALGGQNLALGLTLLRIDWESECAKAAYRIGELDDDNDDVVLKEQLTTMNV
eukprot:g4589.t1